mmetsp:Transcript_58290/g.103534  ORF Transcript_58290/g.103534 Transcript_58290/m.103534 type:complete len:88 (-) Transcript_58290:34-297(-)
MRTPWGIEVQDYIFRRQSTQTFVKTLVVSKEVLGKELRKVERSDIHVPRKMLRIQFIWRALGSICRSQEQCKCKHTTCHDGRMKAWF